MTLTTSYCKRYLTLNTNIKSVQDPRAESKVMGYADILIKPITVQILCYIVVSVC